MGWTFAAETSSSRGSLALFKGTDLVDDIEWPSEKSHSEKITVEANNLLVKNKVAWRDIQHFAVSTGPGSFTGIRVALNFIRTLAYSYDKPIYQVNSLLVLAAPALARGQPVLCLQSAFRNLIYCALYDPKNKNLDSTLVEILHPTAIESDNLKSHLANKVNSPTLAIGLAYDLFKQDLSPDLLEKMKRNSEFSDTPHAKNLLSLINSHSPLVRKSHWAEVTPLYIRASEAEEKLKNN